MPIDTKHPDHIKYSPRWEKMNDALEDEMHIKDKGEEYLKKTAGMIKNAETGNIQYEHYKSNARYMEITTAALTGIMGLVFEREPLGVDDVVITKTGQSNEAFARDVLRGVAGKGRDPIVVDAPKEGGNPYVCRYPAESLINWKVDEQQRITLAVFQEKIGKETDDIYSHDCEIQYREYRKLDSGPIQVSQKNSKGENILEPIILTTPRNEMPIKIPGSIDNLPACDPIPLLPVAYCAFGHYRKSALYEHALYMMSQPTPYTKCVSADQYNAIVAQGLGSSSLLNLGDSADADIGLLEVNGMSIDAIYKAMQDELSRAETHAVRLTQNNSGVEAAEALRIRASAQHASIYSIAHSVSLAVSWAQEFRAEWSGFAKPEPFQIKTEFHGSEAGEQMIRALNEAVNAQNAPREALWEVLRRSGVTNQTNGEIADAIAKQGPGAGGADGLFNTPPAAAA